MKNIARSLLLALVLIGIGYWAWGKFAAPTEPASSGPATTAESMAHEVVVTYFTTDVRCESCQTIESLTRQTVEERFGEELAAGKVQFAIHNIDKPENKHFNEEYELAFKTVVISDRNKGEERSWKKMDEVWDLVDKPEEFKNYLATEIRACLDKPA